MWAFLQVPAVSFKVFFCFVLRFGTTRYIIDKSKFTVPQGTPIAEMSLWTPWVYVGLLDKHVFFYGRRPLLQNHLMEQNVKGFGSKDICSILFVGFITFRIPHIPRLVTPNLATHMNYLAAQREDLFHQDNSSLVGGFKYFYFFISTLLGEMIQFD